MKHPIDNYEFIGQLLRAYDAETLTGYAREAYKSTYCGVWTAFLLGDGSTVNSADLTPNQDSIEWAARHVVGIKHGTIVEGSDAEFEADSLFFPFTHDELLNTWQYLNDQVDMVNKDDIVDI